MAFAAVASDGLAQYDLTVRTEYSQFYLGDSAFIAADTGSPSGVPLLSERRLADD